MTPGRSSRSTHDVEGEMRIGYRMAGLAMEVSAQVAAGAGIGWLFDRWLDSAPKGLLTGAIIGITVGLFSLIKGALKLNRALDRQHPTAGRGQPLPFDDETEQDPDDD